jgi:membrane protein YqaA with SNARE-associated domain
MQDCYQLDLVKHDTISSFVGFCINFWIGHYGLKKQQSKMTQQEIAAEKEQAYEKNSTA